MTQKKSSRLKDLSPLNFLMLTVSGCINAVGIVMFLAPVNLFDSGFSGTAMFLSSVTSLPLGAYLIILNIPFFLFGLKRQGAAFTVCSVYAVLVYSAASFLITDIIPVDVSASSPFAGEDLLLCAVFGGLISGIGSGLTIRFGGAIDGVEVMSVIFAKQLGITVGTFVMIYNVILYSVIGIVRGSWILPLFSIITYTAALKAVDFIVEGFDKAKAAMIITYKPNEISSRLCESFGSGVTLIKANGFYSGTEKTMVYFVVNRFQIGKLKAIVTEEDPTAYVTITEVSDVLRSAVKAAPPKQIPVTSEGETAALPAVQQQAVKNADTQGIPADDGVNNN